MDYILIMRIIYNIKNKFNIITKLCKEDIKMKIHFGLKPFIIKLIKLSFKCFKNEIFKFIVITFSTIIKCL